MNEDAVHKFTLVGVASGGSSVARSVDGQAGSSPTAVVEVIMDRVETDRSFNVTTVRVIAKQAIHNLTKVRNALGLELAATWQDEDEDAIELMLSEQGLERLELPDDQLQTKIRQLRQALPNVDWDAELLADALFVNLSQVQRVLHFREKR